jgi:hypothetical protein
MNYYIQGNKDKADQIKAAFEAKGFIPRIAPMYYGIESVLFFTGTDDYIYETSSPWVMDIIKTHPDYSELELPVEPKFKKGDWIACDADSFTLSIKSLKDGNYYFHQGASLPIKDIDEHYHLWTIADAKDGDVLAINWHEDNDSWEKIIIFKNYHAKGVKGLIKQPCVEGYGNTFKNGKLAFREEVPYYSRTWTRNLQPATKEQRDLLFQKMKENGCEWDAEKKELKKIQTHYNISNFNPFDKVLVRQDDSCTWGVSFFGRYAGMFLCCSNACFTQCIPFNEETKHLLGTTDMPSEEYINW